jgi:RHS repeat-associated protein
VGAYPEHSRGVGDNIIEELNADGGLGERYTYGPRVDEPLVGQRQPKIFYYEADGLGSVTSLTDPTGAIAATYTYDSFGFMTASTGSATNWFRYTGRQFDSTGGIYYYRARYYDPMSGRFLSEDPLRFDAAVNFYSYVLNNPSNLRDSLGLCPKQVCPDYINNFFQTLMPVFRDMADQTGADGRYFAALSSYESGWLGKHAQALHNPFGLTNAGGTDLNFSSYSAAEDYWLNDAGTNRQGYADAVQDATTISEFANALHDAGYNNVTGTWTQDVINQLSSVDKWMGICGVTP